MPRSARSIFRDLRSSPMANSRRSPPAVVGIGDPIPGSGPRPGVDQLSGNGPTARLQTPREGINASVNLLDNNDGLIEL